MIKQIELNNKKIEYTLKVSKRARNMRLAVYRGGDFVVTAPQSARILLSGLSSKSRAGLLIKSIISSSSPLKLLSRATKVIF